LPRSPPGFLRLFLAEILIFCHQLKVSLVQPMFSQRKLHTRRSTRRKKDRTFDFIFAPELLGKPLSALIYLGTNFGEFSTYLKIHPTSLKAINIPAF